MKSPLGRLSFPRLVILVCSLGSIVLGVMVYLRTQRLSEVKAELLRVPTAVKEIQSNAYRLSDLQSRASAEKFKGQTEPESYIRSFTAVTNVDIGQVNISRTTKTPARGIEDTIYKIEPKLKTQRFSLGQIGNFLYKLEAESRRVKVTRIKLVPAEKVAPGEVGKNQWVFDADLTTRSKTDTGKS
ncbi:MAG: hypothetical protein EXS08_12020 [Planctomycetes bacterium]|nr:hypothetical protein [Planctomycetota bacterium]